MRLFVTFALVAPQLSLFLFPADPYVNGLVMGLAGVVGLVVGGGMVMSCNNTMLLLMVEGVGLVAGALLLVPRCGNGEEECSQFMLTLQLAGLGLYRATSSAALVLSTGAIIMTFPENAVSMVR